MTLALLFGASCSDPQRGPAAELSSGAKAWLADVASDVGLDFVHESGATGGLHLPEIMGGGVALFDFDGDGDLDSYLTSGTFRFGGGPVEARAGGRLFRQRGDGTFEDVTREAGLYDAFDGLGVAVGDIDNDGDPDLYASNFGPDRLYRNRGDGTFENVTRAAGIRAEGFSGSAVFCDYDGDGWLDLYVTQYVRYDPDQVCRDSAGRRDYCSPRAYNPVPDILFHNDGDGTFTDVSVRAGLPERSGAGLGVVCGDFDGDGRADFYAANDQYPNHLWINRGDGTFDDEALVRGLAVNLEGRAQAGMGVLAEDLDGDLRLDLFLTHLGGETNTMYRSLGGGLYEDVSATSGLAMSSLPYTGFGTAAFDADLDGHLDLVVANGRVFGGPPDLRARQGEPWNRFAEPSLFYAFRGAGFELAADLAPTLTERVAISRGVAIGDVDDDGDVDVLVGNIQARPYLLLNQAPRRGGWLRVRALDPRLHRDAIGARLTLVGERRSLLRTIRSGFSYLSSSDARAHFGLGGLGRIERIDVRWPDGLEEVFPVDGEDRELTLLRGGGRPH